MKDNPEEIKRNRQTIQEFLETAFEFGEYSTDDAVAFILPLFKEVLTFHEEGLVGPFEKPQALFVTNHCLDIDENLAHEKLKNLLKIESLLIEKKSTSFEVVGTYKVDENIDNGHVQQKDSQVQVDMNLPLVTAAYIPGYRCFEMLFDHHDEQSDIFCLGLALGSIVFGLDLNDSEDLELFAEYRISPGHYNTRIHPTVTALIKEMTELDRKKRTQDLYDVIHRLEHYRDYDPEKQLDLSNISGWMNKELTNRSQVILNKLRNRLFDTSRRNRLLYYKPNARFVNLTVVSVPNVLHYQSIRPELLFTWNAEVAGKISSAKDVVLNKYLRFEDHAYLSTTLNKIRVEAQRNVQEYGFSQLKLVVCFLNWHNLKEDKQERIQSPLLLISVQLKKTKNLIEDTFTLQINDNIAEVNPVLANHLRELYGIRLPDFIDLEEMSMEKFYDLLKIQIEGAKQGVTLNYHDKPRIKFIHSIARQTVNQHRKRLRKAGHNLESYKNIEYSYSKENFKPLGLEIFRQRIESRPSYLEFLVNEDIIMPAHNLTGDQVTKERQTFVLAESENNPHSWDFDTCNIVLGNFNYKKMSLVRDYNLVIDQGIQNEVFENLFSPEPKKYDSENFDLNNSADWYHVVSADPTQTKAILKCRKGESYIIQGPPGTGKSQTITNLIADFVARGKSILFVCEKRAALDVVFYRLKQQGLDELCCYIHDSQTDKKEFIRNLKGTYEDFTRNRMDANKIKQTRTDLIQKMKQNLDVLHQFHQSHISSTEESGMPLRSLMDRIAELEDCYLKLDAKQEELIPSYSNWLQFGEKIKELAKAMEDADSDETFAEHPFSYIRENIFSREQPYTYLEDALTESGKLLNEILSGMNERKVESGMIHSWEQLKELVEDALLLNPLVQTGNLQLISLNSAGAINFNNDIRAYQNEIVEHQKKEGKNIHWTNRFTEQDTETALQLAISKEKSFLKFLNGGWRALKKQMLAAYDFTKHQIKPSITLVLQQLLDEYKSSSQLHLNRKKLENTYRIQDLEEFCKSITALRSKQSDVQINYLMNHNDSENLISQLYKQYPVLTRLEKILQEFLHDHSKKNVNEISDIIENIKANLGALPNLLPVLKNYAQFPENVRNLLRGIAGNTKELEAAMAGKSLQNFYRSNKVFSNIGFTAVEDVILQLSRAYKQILILNGQQIRSNVREHFLGHVDLSNMALSQLDTQKRQFKKEYSEGRKILENEFAKSMRYKSIRELTEKESGAVLKDLKPIWLMSPLSVSDSLPLSTRYFDVIIFDEASQITLEEGIPSLYRAPQTIIVGDDKQMPPSNFFTVKAEDPDDLEAEMTDEDDEWLSNDTDSLLVQGARKLDSVMLGWHYRSRYETLISYSNHAFYEGGLLTIPDKTVHHTERESIIVNQPEDALKFAGALYDRSISYHHLPTGIYEKRSNQHEANYIAQLVKELLFQEKKESIGIVAFSQEQQNTIEDALTALAAKDKKFEQLLEEAYIRVEDDQFVGLFVKNLENVQGDERDIIIMSVCYGFDTRKKMLMNFGPINKKGGEKRLNVIFSRAKRHMAVVGSIHHFNITNEYNEGANYFKRFLHYAELISTGNMTLARTILDGLLVKKNVEIEESVKSSAIASQIKKQLEELGWIVDAQIGQSSFKCSLAVKLKPEDKEYSLAILLDDNLHYGNSNLLEQYYQRPEILKSFGWRTIHVFAKDWISNPQKVIEQIVKRMNEDITAEDKIELPEFNFINLGKTKDQNGGNDNSKETPYDHLVFTRLTFTDETSNKFWEAATDGSKLIVRFGRVGTRGQIQIKTFVNEAAVNTEKEKMIRGKETKGYQLNKE